MSLLQRLLRIDLKSPEQNIEPPDSYWRSLFFFNGYRIVVALLLFGVTQIFGDRLAFGSADLNLFVYVSAAYVTLSGLCFLAIAWRHHFHLQLGIQVSADILIIVVLMFASGGISSGLGLLLLSGLAAAGLISRGRLTLFYAALASIAVLLEQTVQVLFHFGPTTQYVQAGLLSIGYFTTAWVAHRLADYLVATEQIAAQREVDLANMADVNQLVIRDMQDGVLVVDGNGIIRQYNARVEKMLGVMPNNRELNLRDYSPPLARRFDEWRVLPTGFEPMSVMVLSEQVSARFVLVGRRRNVGAVIFLEDLSRVQAQARQMKLAALGRLAANIAHEIRNPLSAINHATELLQEEPVVSSAVSRLLAIIHDNVKRLDRVVNDVLKLNRGERAHRESFEAGSFLRTFAAQFCQIERVPESIFAIELSADPQLSFDHSHLARLMWNLCRNALRQCRRDQASIRIAVDMVGSRNAVKLDVVDDGPGVPAALRNQLFEPFFTTAGSGTGLGLYLAREMCVANDATLEYIETPAGAQFTIMCHEGGDE